MPRKKPLAEDVDLKQIAQTTAGFTGADLGNLMNGGSNPCSGRNKNITQDDIRKSFVKVGIGAEKRKSKSSLTRTSAFGSYSFNIPEQAQQAPCLCLKDKMFNTKDVSSGNHVD